MTTESVMRTCVHNINLFTEYSGRLLAWLTLGMALLTGLIVVLRYGFSIGSIPAQEALIYMHGSLFLLGAAYALKVGAHVRVDIFYRNFSARTRAWVDSLGGIIFLLPLCGFIFIASADYVSASWAMRETSAEPGGIPAVFLLKSLIPLMAINLALQAVADVFRNALILTGVAEQ
jgi:TRAP-type mannitol/chloroaromatic compound transport system permease small subunit